MKIDKRVFAFSLGASLAATAVALWWQRSTNPISLEDKVVIVTGASAGIGRATAAQFAAAGAHVVLVARRESVLQTVAEELAAHPGRVLVVPADITDDAQLEALVSAVLSEFGRIDVLVNNAGLALGGPLTEQDPGRLAKMLDVNLYGGIRLTQLVLPHMQAQGGGHIVNVSSVAGQIPAAGMSAYAATRLGMSGFTDALRREVTDDNIFLSTVYPTWTSTDMTDGIDMERIYESKVFERSEVVDIPEDPARAIVTAVRERRRDVFRGGRQVRMGRYAQRVWPEFLDWAFKNWFDVGMYVDAMRKLG